MKVYKADLHIHTLLSPCAEVEMTPHNIILHAQKNNINIIALTDHNACDNLPAGIMASEGSNVTLILGMEVETKEEVHIVVLFEKMRQMKEWEKIVKKVHSGRKNDEKKFGGQFIVDANDEFVASKEEMLLFSLNISMAEVVNKVHEIGGICIAAHIDRSSHSVVSNMGFIPPDINFDAVEVSGKISILKAKEKFKMIKEMPFITSSDAHWINAFTEGAKTNFYLKEPTFKEIVMALHGEDGRKII